MRNDYQARSLKIFLGTLFLLHLFFPSFYAAKKLYKFGRPSQGIVVHKEDVDAILLLQNLSLDDENSANQVYQLFLNDVKKANKDHYKAFFVDSNFKRYLQNKTIFFKTLFDLILQEEQFCDYFNIIFRLFNFKEFLNYFEACPADGMESKCLDSIFLRLINWLKKEKSREYHIKILRERANDFVIYFLTTPKILSHLSNKALLEALASTSIKKIQAQILEVIKPKKDNDSCIIL